MTAEATAHERSMQSRGAVVAGIGLLLVPFIQFGVTYWLSVQGALFLLALVFVRKRLNHLQLLLFVAIGLTMLASLLGHAYSGTLFYAFLRIVRQIVCLFLIMCAATTASWHAGPVFFRRLLPAVVSALCGLVILQYVTYTLVGWTVFFVPAQLYVQGIATLADTWLQFGLVHGVEVHVRPSATYSEPSYFGFVTLSLAMLVLKGVEGRLRWALLGLMLLALLCSRSASGLVLFVGLIVFAHRRHLSPLALLAAVLVGSAVVLGADTLMGFHLIDRILSVMDPVKERSGYIRLVLPFKHILLVLEQKPLGVPMSELFAFTSRHLADYSGSGAAGPVSLVRGMTEGTDNGFLNLFITYGFGAFVIIGLVSMIVRDKLTLVFLFFVAQFNGDIFSPDKAAVVALVLGCHRLAAEAAPRPERQRRSAVVNGPFGAAVAWRR